MNIRTVKEQIEMFEPGPDDPKARRDRRRLLTMLEAADAPFSRKQFDPGHVTASALIFSPDLTEVLAGHHAKLKKWLQPGGHVDAGDKSLPDAARRETREETGVALDENEPPVVGVDVHLIPALKGEPEHEHYDVMFVWRAASKDTGASAETPEVAWMRPDDPRLEGRLAACAARALKFFK